MKLFEFLREYLQGIEQADGTYSGGLGFSPGITTIIIGAIFAVVVILITLIGLFVFKKILKRGMQSKLKKIKAEQERLEALRNEKEKKNFADVNLLFISEVKGDSPYQYVDVSKRSETITKATYKIVASIVWVIAIIIILDGFGVNIVPFITGAGIVGIAVAFGAQEFVKDFISGLFNIFENTYSVGELVEINGFGGTVREIGLRTTKIENWRGEYFIINNGKIDSVINRSRDNSLAAVDVVLPNKISIDVAKNAILSFCENFVVENPNLLEKPRFLGIVNASLISNTFRVVAYTKPATHHGIEREIRIALLDHLEKEGIDSPQTIVVTQ